MKIFGLNPWFFVFVLVCFDQALKVFIKSNFYLGEQLDVFSWFSTVLGLHCAAPAAFLPQHLLVDGGYKITRVVPIDQFLYSSHVEVVAHLER